MTADCSPQISQESRSSWIQPTLRNQFSKVHINYTRLHKHRNPKWTLLLSNKKNCSWINHIPSVTFIIPCLI